jgi:hypothetical protein
MLIGVDGKPDNPVTRGVAEDISAAAYEHVEVNASPSPVLLFDLSGNGADRGGG